MLTPKQAESVADGLIEAQKRERLQALQMRIRPVPLLFLYSSSALRRLRPSEQAQLCEQASRSVNSSLSLLWFSCAWAAACVTAWWLLGGPRFADAFPLVMVLIVGPALWRICRVRLELRALLAARAQSDRSE